LSEKGAFPALSAVVLTKEDAHSCVARPGMLSVVVLTKGEAFGGGFTRSIQRASYWNRSPLRNVPQTFENSEFDFRELRGIERPHFTNGADSRVRGNALRDKRTVFEKWNLHSDFKLRAYGA
jgi:hypothetical protein